MKLTSKYKCNYCGKKYKLERFFLQHLENCKLKPKNYEEINNAYKEDSIQEWNEHEEYLIKFYKHFNPNIIIGTPTQLNKLFKAYEFFHNECAGNRNCEGVQKFVIINLYKYYMKYIKIKIYNG